MPQKCLRRGGDLLFGEAELLRSCHTAGRLLHIGEDDLGACDGVVDALTGNALLLRDLAERKILIVVKIKVGFLLFRQQAAVIIEEQRHFERFLFHFRHPQCPVIIQ